LGRHPVEGVVDFDRVEALGVVGEHLVGRELLGIERTAPLRIVVAGGADQVAHGGRWYQRPSPAARVANSTICRSAQYPSSPGPSGEPKNPQCPRNFVQTAWRSG